ncbi:MAG: hypothetical protein M3N47_06730 [Chloroflexota bacterium]|nr:hypothetical protein [Chloroflexota bacterium]
MIESSLTDLNLEKARGIVSLLRDLGYRDQSEIGRLSADLSDLYAGAERYKRLLDLLLATSPRDYDQFGQVLSDLHAEMQHLSSHLASSLDDIDALAERFD